MNNTILEKKKRVSDQVLYALIQLSSFNFYLISYYWLYSLSRNTGL